VNGVTLITCTGMRAESIRRCTKYVHRFYGLTYQPVQWIVVDDGDVQTHVPYMGDNATVEEKLIRPAHRWSAGQNTLALNLLAAIPHVKWDKVLFIEDDDQYAPGYMTAQVERMASADLVGETPSRYYHVPSRKYRIMPVSFHASLSQTAMRATMLPVLKSVCESSPEFIDVRLWNNSGIQRRLSVPDRNVVGMKGLPGREGIGIGHRPEMFGIGWRTDPGLETIKNWLGSDINLYPTLKTASEAVLNVA
jgi:hypothetical protein